MVDEGIISRYNAETIDCQHTPLGKCSRLLEIMPKRGLANLVKFIMLLKAYDQPVPRDILVRSLNAHVFPLNVRLGRTLTTTTTEQSTRHRTEPCDGTSTGAEGQGSSGQRWQRMRDVLRGKTKDDEPATPGDSDDLLCAVCMDNKKSTIYIPCGHIRCCYACALRVTETEDTTCMECRRPVAKIIPYFM